MKHRIFDKVVSFIEANHMITDGDTVVTGVSGGADSVCLLFLLCELRKKYNLSLAAVHVNHGIREEAGDDAEYVRALCEGWKVPFSLVKADVPALADRWKLSEEEAGRKVRYEAFEAEAAKFKSRNVKIAVAHNKNDNAETVLFHMFRGSGLHGLTGIPAKREHGDFELIRPILCLERQEIETLLREQGIEWVTDCTNLKDGYSRNRIRLNILPEAEEVAPGAMKHIVDTAAQLSETESLLQLLEDECLRDVKDKGIDNEESAAMQINVRRLENYHPVIIKRALLSILKDITGGGRDIGALQVGQLMELVTGEGNRHLDLARGVKAERIYDAIVIKRNIANSEDDFCGVYEKKQPIIETELISAQSLPGKIDALLETVRQGGELNKYTKWLDYDKIDGQFVVRTRREGDYFLIKDSKGDFRKKSLKDYMIDQKIPAAIRGDIPVVADGSKCLWLVGYRTSDDVLLSGDTQRILKLWTNYYK